MTDGPTLVADGADQVGLAAARRAEREQVVAALDERAPRTAPAAPPELDEAAATSDRRGPELNAELTRPPRAHISPQPRGGLRRGAAGRIAVEPVAQIERIDSAEVDGVTLQRREKRHMQDKGTVAVTTGTDEYCRPAPARNEDAA